ncbi:hypothetical protein BDK51DRAFT_27943, partial [Blyttiomyces helicus]
MRRKAKGRAILSTCPTLVPGFWSELATKTLSSLTKDSELWFQTKMNPREVEGLQWPAARVETRGSFGSQNHFSMNKDAQKRKDKGKGMETVRAPCEFFFGKGGCRNGEKCWNSHDPALRNLVTSASSPSPQHKKPSYSRVTGAQSTGAGPSRAASSSSSGSSQVNRAGSSSDSDQYIRSASSSSGSNQVARAGSSSDADQYIRAAPSAATGQNAIRREQRPAAGAPAAARPAQQGGASDAHVWRRFVREETTAFRNQHQMRFFVASCIKATSEEELLIQLSQPGGLRRVDEICQAVSSVDAGTGVQFVSFQRVIIPFLEFITSRAIANSVLKQHSNKLYNTAYNSGEDFFCVNVLAHLETLWKRQSLDDRHASVKDIALREGPGSVIPTSFSQVFLPSIRIAYEILTRFRPASLESWLATYVSRLGVIVTAWEATPAATADALGDRIRVEMSRLKSVFNDGRRAHEAAAFPDIERARRLKQQQNHAGHGFMIWDLQEFDPPGSLSDSGPRHNNDFAEIGDIEIVPTMEEILAVRSPFMPGNAFEAPHHLDPGPARHLDIQFRLLREDMVAPFRDGLKSLMSELNQPKKASNIKGKFRNQSHDATDLNIYKDAHVTSLVVNPRLGVVFEVSFTPPAYPARFKSKQQRKEFWNRSKRLVFNGLVCLLLVNKDARSENGRADAAFSWSHHIVFATVVGRDEKRMSEHEELASVKLQIIEKRFFPEMIVGIRKALSGQDEGNLLVEAPGVFFEAYRPILSTLQKFIPGTLPFSRYLAPETGAIPQDVEPPLYARGRTFSWDLAPVLIRGNKILKFKPGDVASRDHALRVLRQDSKLDWGQCDAFLDCLEREVALVQGPPGTGKTYLGVEIVRILLSLKKVSTPILCICQTNHALDQFLEHLIKINVKIVRIGSRTKSDIVAKYHIDEVCKTVSSSKTLGWDMSRKFKERDALTGKVKSIMSAMEVQNLTWDVLQPHLVCENDTYYMHFAARHEELMKDKEEGWTQQGRKGVKDLDVIGCWLRADDIRDLLFQHEAWKHEVAATPKNPNYNAYEFLSGEDQYLPPRPPPLPTGDRPLASLMYAPLNPYDLSKPERDRLHAHWRDQIRAAHQEEIPTITAQLTEITRAIDELQDEKRRQVLKEIEVIGVTTNGAAKFTNLLRAVAPPIVLCEEAGEVLEAHILSALTASTQHLILIGDPLQLRPSIVNYRLSLDSKEGKSYMLDKSLLERLAQRTTSRIRGSGGQEVQLAGLPMSQLNVQRRMRPDIADLIRTALYPKLVDGENTKLYPDVSGIAKNLFFIDHSSPEDGANDPFAVKSHCNKYEAAMAAGLVKHFLRN